MRIAVLALQGAFVEHERRLKELGGEPFEIRQLADWQQQKAGLVIPGGESTTMMRLLHDLQLFLPIREAIREGLPVLGTCAGLILLDRQHLGTMDILAERNAYGRQLGSFHTTGDFSGQQVPMTFIRAPYIKEMGEGVEALASIDGRIVAARERQQLATAFHPELDDDPTVHQLFLRMCATT